MKDAINNNATIILGACIILAFAIAGFFGVEGLEKWTDTLVGALLGGAAVLAKKSGPTP